jgi:hypothetical protein
LALRLVARGALWYSDIERGNKNQQQSPARNEWGFSHFKERKMRESQFYNIERIKQFQITGFDGYFLCAS